MKAAVSQLLKSRYRGSWRAKFDLEEPASLPPMLIELMPGAKPASPTVSSTEGQQPGESVRESVRLVAEAQRKLQVFV